MPKPDISNLPPFEPIGAWDIAPYSYSKSEVRQPYGIEDSYAFACGMLEGCNTVEDWGCGLGFAKKFFDPDKTSYTGIDGTKSKWCDVVDDLRTRCSEPDGILMRHVLEHNLQWDVILLNAIKSAKKRLVLVGFMKLVEETLYEYDKDGIPCISFKASDIEQHLEGCQWTRHSVETDTVWVIDKPCKA